MIGYHVMEYMGRTVRKTCFAVAVALLMLALMGQAQSRRSLAAAMVRTDTGPWSAEFSLTRDDGSVGLGAQEGAFPWGTGLEVSNRNFWRSGGQDFFEITGADGSQFKGTRQGGMADTSNGFLLEIRTQNPDWRTLRGACVGMSMEEVLALYPEASAEYDAHREAGSYRYTYCGAVEKFSGFSRISFTFEQNILTSLDIQHVAA